jgi:flagellar basal-body rod protein FlgB
MKLFDATLGRLEHALDVRLLRHNVLSNNLANADTPGFTPMDLDFRSQVEAAEAAGGGSMARTSPGHLEGETASTAAPAANNSGERTPPALVPMAGAAPSMDGNEVDVDRTMAALAENAIQYGATARAAGKKLAILRYVVSDGNG